jgi:hypothetical protein
MKLRIMVATAVLGLMGSVANAGWLFYTDTVSGDASNPSYITGVNAPPPHDEATIAAWLSDLTNTTISAPATNAVITSASSFSGICGGGVTTCSGVLAVHLGGGSTIDNVLASLGLITSVDTAGGGGFELAFVCATDCDSINLLARSTYGLAGFGVLDARAATSNFRFYGTRASVPEPATLGILGLGLAGVGFARRRRAA